MNDNNEEQNEDTEVKMMVGGGVAFFNEVKAHKESIDGGRYWMVMLMAPTQPMAVNATVYEFSGLVEIHKGDEVELTTLESMDTPQVLEAFHERAHEHITEKQLDAIPVLLDFEDDSAYCTKPEGVEVPFAPGMSALGMPATIMFQILFKYYETFAEKYLGSDD